MRLFTEAETEALRRGLAPNDLAERLVKLHEDYLASLRLLTETLMTPVIWAGPMEEPK